MGLFGKSKGPDPKEQVREWKSCIRKESNKMRRQIQGIQREQEKVKRQIKTEAKKGNKDVLKIYAKEIVRSNKAIARIYSGIAQMNSVGMQMDAQLATLRISGALQQSTEVMQSMQQLVKLPEIQATMMEMSKEMTKAGILEEMIDDTMEVLDDDELDEEADEEVDKVLFEVVGGALANAPAAGSDTLPQAQAEEAEVEDDDADEMMQRLEALKS